MKKIVLSLASVLLFITVNACADDIAQGQTLAGKCIACHPAGPQPSPVQRPLIDKEKQFIADKLIAYRDGTIENPIMKIQAGQLSDEDIANLAAYYSSLN